MIKQMTPVYHIDHGKGFVLSITHRYKSNLVMCRFKGGVYDWILERDLLSGTGQITLKKQKKPKHDDSLDTLEQAIMGIIRGGE